MLSSAVDYQRLYKLQDQTFAALTEELEGFYLTGGTALGRFYLDHRFSEDIEFFTNANPLFSPKTNSIYRKLKETFSLVEDLTLITPSYARFYISGINHLKIDVVNDVPEHWGSFNEYMGVKIDNPANILSNKLAMILDREEPKDVFDIVSIAEVYSFNWRDVYHHTLLKQITNETDISMKLSSFPVKWLQNQIWLKGDVNQADFAEKLHIIADDIILARDNSFGIDKPSLEEALIRD